MSTQSSRPRRVLYIHQYFAEPESTGGTRSYELARRLVRDGHQVKMLTSTAFLPPRRNSGERTMRYRVDGIDVVALTISYSNSSSFWRRIAAFVTFALRATWEASRGPRVDVVFATSTPLTVAIPAIVARLRHRARFVFEVRDLWPEIPIEMGYIRARWAKWTARLLARTAYRSADQVVALSTGMAAGIRRQCSDAHIAVVPNACDIEVFRRPSQLASTLPIAVNDVLVLYAGTVGVANDVRWMVSLAREFASMHPLDPVKFLIIGDGAERGLVEDFARQAAVLDNNLVLHAPVPKQEMPGLLQRATVALSLFADFPLLTTTSPNKLFDALAAGTPVAVNYGGWQAELLERTGAGLALSRDPHAAASALGQLITDPTRIETARTAARNLAREFDRERLYEQWASALLGA